MTTAADLQAPPTAELQVPITSDKAPVAADLAADLTADPAANAIAAANRAVVPERIARMATEQAAATETVTFVSLVSPSSARI